MMWFKIIVSFLCVFVAFEASAYDTLRVEASLDTARKEIIGHVLFDLSDCQSSDDIVFQLIPNLYSENDSPLDSRHSRLYRTILESGKWGEMIIDSILIDNSNKTEFLTIENMSARFEIDKSTSFINKSIKLFFKTRLPGVGDRLFYIDNEYMLDGWFPFPAPRDSLGKYKMPNYGAFAELVGDYFYYDINLTLPENLIVSAAVPSEKIKLQNGLVKHTFNFGSAHDFALALSPDFKVDLFNYENINIRVHYHDYDISVVPRVKKAVLASLEYMIETVGDYEYGNLTIAIINSGFSGGIEFPGFISVSSPRGTVNGTNTYDFLIVHEVVHQWFYGMISSDQCEEPWLDESITVFHTLKIAEKFWGEEANLLDYAGMRLSERDFIRLNSQIASNLKDINDPASSFINNSEYYGTIYNKGGLIIETLDNLLPDSISSRFWKEYSDEFKFKRASTTDFLNKLSEIAGKEFAKIADYLINSIVDIDYSVNEVANQRLDSVTYEAHLQFEKTGELNIPVDYRIVLSNNDTLDYKWLSEYNIEEITHRFSVPVKTVIIDPENKIAVDRNLLNNSLTIEADNRPGLRLSSALMFLLESLFSFLGGI